MLKVKNIVKKKGSPSKGAVAKAKKPVNPIKQTKQKNVKKNVKVVKKAVKDGLVKAPKPPSPKVGATPPVKKVTNEKELAAKKEKLRQKRLKMKLKKAAAKEAAAKKALALENGQEKSNSASEIKEPQKDPEQNGTEVETTQKVDVISPLKAKNKKKKQSSAEGKEKKKGSPGTPEQTVFVGNLPTNTKRVQLIKLFNAYAPILAIRFRTASGKVIFKHKFRKESGALNAYIILKDKETATKALELNGVEFKGNHLRVTKTDKIEKVVDSKRVVFVGNLKYSATDEKLRQIFSSCGEIEYVRTLQQTDKPGCKGVAYVCFKNPDSVGLALELKGTILDERPIHVERYSLNKLEAKVKKDSESGKVKTQASQKGKKFGGAKKKTPPTDDGKKKKSEFRGVKSDVNKKKQKKKIPNVMKKLAKKIAPKSDE